MQSFFEPQSPEPVRAAPVNLPYVAGLAITAALGGLLFGYDWVVIGGAAKFYETYFQLSETAIVADNASAWVRLCASLISPIGWAQSCALLGCLVGALLSGALSDRFGRRPVLILAAANFVISSVAIALADNFTVFVIWRILGGVSIGLASNISPMYISEIAPAKQRGLLIAVNQLTIVLGVLLAQWMNWQIAEPVAPSLDPALFLTTWNVQMGWRWMFAACAAPSVLFFVCALLLPESPRWLMKFGRHAEALAIFRRIGGPIPTIADEGNQNQSQPGAASVSRMIREPRLRRILALGIGLAVFQQWCGINVIFNYAGEIFGQAGYDLNDTLTNIVMTGLVNLVFTIAALLMVDRVGRKPLMVGGALLLSLIYGVLGWAFYAKGTGEVVSLALFLGLILAAIASYAVSLAPVIWVIIAEIFPTRIRGRAMSIAVGALWVACFVLTYTFPLLNVHFGPAGLFWIYGGVCFAGLIFVLRYLPETKGRSLEQLEHELFKR